MGIIKIEDDTWFDIDKQHHYLDKYRLDPIEVGYLCDKYPALKNSWEQFKIVFELCRNNDEQASN